MKFRSLDFDCPNKVVEDGISPSGFRDSPNLVIAMHEMLAIGACQIGTGGKGCLTTESMLCRQLPRFLLLCDISPMVFMSNASGFGAIASCEISPRPSTGLLPVTWRYFHLALLQRFEYLVRISFIATLARVRGAVLELGG
jgi:hypothetical protein